MEVKTLTGGGRERHSERLGFGFHVRTAHTSLWPPFSTS